MNDVEQITQMDIFYHFMNYTSKGIIDAAYCGAFKRKSAEEASQLIEYLVKSNYRAPSEASGSNVRLREGVIERNKMTEIEANLNALMSGLGNQYRRVHSAHEVGVVVDAKKKNEEGLVHEGPYNMEEVQYIQGNKGYNFKPNNNLPTHHTLALRNDENLSYGGGVHQNQRPMQNHQQKYAPQGFQGQQH